MICCGCGGDRLLPLTFEALMNTGSSEGRCDSPGRPHFKCLRCGRRMGRAARAPRAEA